MNYFLTKTIHGGIEDVDMAKRTVKLYYSNFDSKDSDGDVIRMGAMTKTHSEWGPGGANRIKHWKNHNSNLVIGKPLELFEDSKGAGAISWIGSNSTAKDALIDYQEGLITEHSFGYDIVSSKEFKDYQELRELKVFEYSAVALGANENTPVVDIKGMDKDVLAKWFDERFKTITKLTKAKNIGEYSDEKLISIEHSILVITKQLQQAILEKFAQPLLMIEIEKAAASKKIDAELINLKELFT